MQLVIFRSNEEASLTDSQREGSSDRSRDEKLNGIIDFVDYDFERRKITEEEFEELNPELEMIFGRKLILRDGITLDQVNKYSQDLSVYDDSNDIINLWRDKLNLWRGSLENI